MDPLIVFGIFAIVAVIFLANALKIVQEYERAVIFRLGRVLPGAKGPGLFFIIPILERMVKVNLQTITVPVPSQQVISRDNVTVLVDAVAYFNVVEPVRAVINIQSWFQGASQVCQTTLRSVCGTAELDELLSERERLNADIQRITDSITEQWGVKVTLVEIKDVALPPDIQRAMARQAEAERERRAKIINAEGEFQSAQRLSEAAAVIARQPIAYQLRMLQTVTEVAAEKNSTLVLPIPIELLGPYKAAFGGLGNALLPDAQPPAVADPDDGDGDRRPQAVPSPQLRPVPDGGPSALPDRAEHPPRPVLEPLPPLPDAPTP